jgi:hypothetical protein
MASLAISNQRTEMLGNAFDTADNGCFVKGGFPGMIESFGMAASLARKSAKLKLIFAQFCCFFAVDWARFR